MEICIIGIDDEYFRIGLEHILKCSISQVLPNEILTIYRVCKSDCDVVFIDVDSLSITLAIAKVKSIRLGVMIFIIATRKAKFNRVNSFIDHKGFFIYKNEHVNPLIKYIKSNFSYKSLRMGDCSAVNVSFPNKELTICQNIIINLIYRGLNSKDISVILNKSEKTISSHKRAAMKKLGVNTNYELYELGLFERVYGTFY